MKLSDLFLKKEELPIIHETSFSIPIHPRLLKEDISLNPQIAQNVFPEATDSWYADLEQYSKGLEFGQMRDWIESVFLLSRPKILREYGIQRLSTIYWEDNVDFNPNGFARFFSISRNFGGSLYFNQGDPCVRDCFFLGDKRIHFSEEKLKEFGEPLSGGGAFIFNVYAQHNIDSYPGALFLRNWAILYMNEALKQVFE